ncbi:hypothetical protein GY45DRAFT_1332089 [Cubamyces sp. BRFM 1775]|nr:hypothetical protein GY45DRAFT_1332089 [Cubamyces sp. BRFM 1775]
MATGPIIVVNNSTGSVHAFVSIYNTPNGNGSWQLIPSGVAYSWSRNDWEVVAFKNADDTKRAGVYVQVDTTVIYNSLSNLIVA